MLGWLSWLAPSFAVKVTPMERRGEESSNNCLQPPTTSWEVQQNILLRRRIKKCDDIVLSFNFTILQPCEPASPARPLLVIHNFSSSHHLWRQGGQHEMRVREGSLSVRERERAVQKTGGFKGGGRSLSLLSQFPVLFCHKMDTENEGPLDLTLKNS